LCRAIATLLDEECARPLLNRMEKVKPTIRRRSRECNKECAAVFRDAP
jgi:hypothetical protein